MKTIIWTCCYLMGNDDNGGNNFPNARYLRHTKWLDYLDSIKGKFHFEEIWLVDNASDMEKLKSLGGNIYTPDFQILSGATTRSYLNIVHFDEFLGRKSVWDYEYCYRAMYFMDKVIDRVNPDKIVSLDTDFYLLKSTIVDYFNKSNNGWISFRCPKYGFPEAAMFILNRDSFHLYKKFISKPWTEYNGKNTLEVFLPFTFVETKFKGDRYGETNTQQEAWMEWYGQAPVKIQLTFDMK